MAKPARGDPSLSTEAVGARFPAAFGPFRVLHQIGSGTWGPVFRAYDQARDRPVAVKLFTLDLTPEHVRQLVAQFQRLIEAALDHPALAAPIATGPPGRPRIWFTSSTRRRRSIRQCANTVPRPR